MKLHYLMGWYAVKLPSGTWHSVKTLQDALGLIYAVADDYRIQAKK